MWNWYPPVGFFIAILALLGVLVPLFRDLAKIGPREKAVWTFVMFLLVSLEFRTLYLDRADHDQKEADARSAQLKGFKEIGAGIEAAIQKSQDEFDVTMTRIEATLKTSEETLQNTKPTASLEFRTLDVYAPSLPMAVGHQLGFNIAFTNAGNDIAKNAIHDARLYVRRIDDPEAQREIANDFNKWWDTSSHPAAGDVRPNSPSFFSFKSLPLLENEVSGILNHSLTLYILNRFTWTDRTGRWASDECFAFQDPTHDLVVGHPCTVFTRHRYRVKQHPSLLP